MIGKRLIGVPVEIHTTMCTRCNAKQQAETNKYFILRIEVRKTFLTESQKMEMSGWADLPTFESIYSST